MPEVRTQHAREHRIEMEIVVDAYGPEERAMGWYCYLEEKLAVPFQAPTRRSTGVVGTLTAIQSALENPLAHRSPSGLRCPGLFGLDAGELHQPGADFGHRLDLRGHRGGRLPRWLHGLPGDQRPD